MTNAELAIELAVDYLESEGIVVDTPSITRVVNKWEDRLDPIDFISLAAVAISDPQEIALTTSEIREIREFYFPQENYVERGFTI